MLQLNGSGQYAWFDGLTDVEGVVNYAPLPRHQGYPFWWSIDFRAAVLGQNNFIACVSQASSGINFFLAQFNNGTVQSNDGSGGSAVSGITAGAWHRLLVCADARNSVTTFVDGDPGPTYTTDRTWPQGVDAIGVGARIYAGTTDHYFNGDLANFAVGAAPPSPSQRTAHVLGVNPLSLPGCYAYWPLETDALDTFGVWPLTLAGLPSITAIGHPAVSAWPPAGGSRSRAGVYAAGSSPRIRSAF